MKSSIKEHLIFVYGSEQADEIEQKLNKLIERYRPRLSAFQEVCPLSQCDSLLITYGDQVSTPGEAPLKTLSDFCNQRLKGVIGGVHILPFYPFSSDDGFSVIDYFAVNPDFGSWKDVEDFGRHFYFMFDAVVNHISAQSEWFKGFLKGDSEYSDYFITVEGDPDLSQVVRPRALPLLTTFDTAKGKKKVWTTFSADQVDLNFKNPEVLLAIIESLLFYISEGARFIRLDAIAFLWKEIGTQCLHLPQTHHIVQLIRALFDQEAPYVRIITETNVPHELNLSYFGDGTNEAHLVYNFALPPLIVHSIQAGQTGVLGKWIESLKLPSDQVTFFNFLASHDGIGVNPVRGILKEEEIEAMVQRCLAHNGLVSYKNNPDGTKSPYEININYFDALSNPNDKSEPLDTQINRFIVAQATMLALEGMPGIYFHSLFGSRNSRHLADESGIPRRINRQKFSKAELEGELADSTSLRARVFEKFCQLLKIRSSQKAFSLECPQQVLPCDERVLALLRFCRKDEKLRVLCLHNFSNETVQTKINMPQAASSWINLLNKEKYASGKKNELVITLAPYEIAWLFPEGQLLSSTDKAVSYNTSRAV